MQLKNTRYIVVCGILLSSFSTAWAYVDPANAAGASEFDWQQEWGSIHMNSYADGLNDPGSHATANGNVPCASGTVCKTAAGVASPPTGFLSGSAISNGIKFDIKNSLLNCASQPMPTWAYNNVWDPWHPSNGVCVSKYGLSWPAEYAKAKNKDDNSPTGFPHTLVYQPIWDPRSNDTRSKDVERIVGCQQQISNSCVQDIHACIDVTNPSSPVHPPESEAGYRYPVSHVFTPQEVADLGGKGTQLPTTYWHYKKIITPAVPASPGTPEVPAVVRNALSASDPTSRADTLAGSVVMIQNTSDPQLARIKTYRVNSLEGNSKFIVVDPSDFFDLKLYVAGGKYASGYNKFDPKTKLPLIPESCPVAGLSSGYGGICDPTPGPNNAGCNLPIYEVGPTTTFTSIDNKTYYYANYTVSWSGYVKKWAVISVAQYLENIRGRESFYLEGAALNSNNIIMLTRADGYCENHERMSDPLAVDAQGFPIAPDMSCVHYLQYQATDVAGTTFAWVNLYNPSENFVPSKNEFSTLMLYNLKPDGKPDPSSPVAGTGSNRYIGSHGKANKSIYLSFKDTNAKYSYYEGKTLKTANAVYKADYSGTAKFDPSGRRISGPVYSTKRDASGNLIPTTGEYTGQNGQGGAGVLLKPGTANVIRTKSPVLLNGSSTTCSVITLSPTANENLFIPTNTTAELSSFLNSYLAATSSESGVTVRTCQGTFMNATEAATKVSSSTISGATTWVGKANCNALKARPACNMTEIISAKRFCELENGSLGSCSACGGVADPDDKNFFRNAAKNVTGQSILIDPGLALGASGRCYFTASCFNNSATGCPVAGTSGGHVFCFAPDTLILMGDGTQKAIKDIKAGEEVASFNAKHTKNSKLDKAKVKATAQTKSQKVIQINNLKLTPLHKVVLSTGRSVVAQDIKVGDKLLKADGLIEEVTKISSDLKPITVYNLVLEREFDGYVAGGIRVMSYPLLKGMDVTSKFSVQEIIDRSSAQVAQ